MFSRFAPLLRTSTSTTTTTARTLLCSSRLSLVQAVVPAVLERSQRTFASIPPTSTSTSTSIAADESSSFVSSIASEEPISTSFVGASVEPFPAEVAQVLMAEINEDDVEIKPDGLLYLPEIKYRRILNKAFGPGGWAMVPRGPHTVSQKSLSREYALFCLGRFTAIARVKSNALMRCCKDLGIASELWDPVFVRDFKSRKCTQVWGTNNSGQKNKSSSWKKQ
ncbi:mitochondrial genome maintenance MGM101 [Rhizoclosmatium globosum]|uniref:Mitochondrial genome maintenance protein MGM101 n=1 Tax=Rhizoclosmatium globosum TaxID=329046 RepID=A0A1Y2BKT8_9FUNG|nr:mitochondrial genome maintenance MGM101 [Rhizoclosmatium globosum]|eukprot:ORY35227.1 mitochondrial genome maintenance MGM101 [Rhizoclosmatium globosum]